MIHLWVSFPSAYMTTSTSKYSTSKESLIWPRLCTTDPCLDTPGWHQPVHPTGNMPGRPTACPCPEKSGMHQAGSPRAMRKGYLGPICMLFSYTSRRMALQPATDCYKGISKRLRNRLTSDEQLLPAEPARRWQRNPGALNTKSVPSF